MLQTLRYFVREAIIGFYRARAMNLVTVSIIAASLSVLGGFLILSGNLGALAEGWDRVQINAYLKDDAVADRPSEVERLIEALESRPIVDSVRFVSRKEALAIFRSRFASLAGAADSLSANPFPASIEITARGRRTERAAGTEEMIEELKSSPLVESVQDNEEEARKLLSILAVVSSIGLGVGGVLAAASVFIIFNVIRLTVHARRDEINIMRLVGATGGFIRGPFLVEGMLQGVLGAAGALALLYGGHVLLMDYAARSGSALAGLLSAQFLPTARAVGLAGGGLLIGLAGSALSLRRFLVE